MFVYTPFVRPIGLLLLLGSNYHGAYLNLNDCIAIKVEQIKL